jgi:hypothetical protein
MLRGFGTALLALCFLATASVVSAGDKVGDFHYYVLNMFTPDTRSHTPTHFLTLSAMFRGVATALLALCLLASTGVVTAGDKVGDFDYYVLSMFWQPAECGTLCVTQSCMTV